MAKPQRASHWLAAALLFVAVSCPSATRAEIRRDTGPARNGAGAIEALVESLERWLDRNSSYPRNGAAVTIRQVGPAEAGRLEGRSSRAGLTPRGFYDPETATIFLVSPWSRQNDHDVSVLVHELVHHRQQIAGHWYCPGAQELPAYRLQDRWLAGRGLSARVSWIAVVLESGCSSRDIHPE